jgi:hypothetical protein
MTPCQLFDKNQEDDFLGKNSAIPQPKMRNTFSKVEVTSRQVPESWQVTRSFLVWLFLSWSIDYRTENLKS